MRPSIANCFKTTTSKFKQVDTYANTTLSTEIGTLIEKVDLNNTFLKLGKNDGDLIADIRKALENLYAQSKRREILYIAVEHNTKYLASVSLTLESERNAAVAENAKLKNEIIRIKSETKEMAQKFVVYEKDSQ